MPTSGFGMRNNVEFLKQDVQNMQINWAKDQTSQVEGLNKYEG